MRQLKSNFAAELRIKNLLDMRVYFSFDYKGGKAYLGMKEQPLMMDMQVTDIGGLWTSPADGTL